MARTKNEAGLQTCELTQELMPEYWHIPDGDTTLPALLKQAESGDIKPLMQYLGDALSRKNIFATEMHGILHDKDVQRQWSEREQKEILVQKTAHIHILMKFEDERHRGTLNDIASACLVEPQYIEKPQRGRYAYDNMLSYLVHAKYEDKYQYRADEVITIIPVDKDGKPLSKSARNYSDIYNERFAEWVKGRAAIKKKTAMANVDYVVQQILQGKITRSQVMLTDELFTVYSYNDKRIDDAFRIYGEHKAYKALQALQNNEFKVSVFFITGRSGSGKTRFANQFIDTLLAKNEGWQVCKTAATNPVDDYNGEEILFMDDVRGAAMSATDWLKLLDPYNVTPSSARYHNKTVAARVIIITSEKNPLEFFYYVRTGGGNRSEALDQFIRRIEALVTVIPYSDDYNQTNIAIQTTSVVGNHRVVIPNSRDNNGNTAIVNMNYGFSTPQTSDIETASQTLQDIVKHNNFSA